MDLSAFGLVLLVSVAAALDLGTRRIPNALTVGGLMVALGLRCFSGVPAVTEGLLGALIAFGVSFPLFLLGGMGGGDVKLLSAVGAFLGPHRLWIALLAMALAGGVLALGVALVRRRLLASFAGMFRVLRHVTMRAVGIEGTGAVSTLSSPDAVAVPYGVAIAVGALFGLVMP